MKSQGRIFWIQLLVMTLVVGLLCSSGLSAFGAEKTVDGVVRDVDMSRISTEYDTDDQEVIQILHEMEKDFEYYGNQGLYDNLPVSDYQTRSWSTFADCIVTKLVRAYGIDVIRKAFTAEVRMALKSQQWKVASAIFFRTLQKCVGKAAAAFVIKRIAHLALPGGFAGQIAWACSLCAVKEIW
ncbi:hypothetical protein [Alloscardovia macacae]|uniref:Uncharacterized protein n=1 Tax=Alloscardovia macacae TaxID=1160091 RepID=A0A261F759_9BIFI|nr:hypothetical protein [Alloscardovia macacae]OZG54716.1 hypothetical protein ALMA_0041 [Alloscardovia macacae]